MSTQFQYKTQCLPKTYARLPGHRSLSFKALSFITDFTVVGHGTQNLLQTFHLIAHLPDGRWHVRQAGKSKMRDP